MDKHVAPTKSLMFRLMLIYTLVSLSIGIFVLAFLAAVYGEVRITFIVLSAAVFALFVVASYFTVYFKVTTPVLLLLKRANAFAVNDFAEMLSSSYSAMKPQVNTGDEFTLLEQSMIEWDRRISDEVIERRRAAAARDKEAKRITTMLDALPLGCQIWSKDYTLLDCNKAAVELFGFKNKKELFKRYAECFPKYQEDGRRTIELIPEIINRTIKKGIVSFTSNYRIADLDEAFPAETTLVSTELDDDIVIVGYVRDLREERRHMQKLLESDERARILEIEKQTAQAISDAKTQFLASISHEIRTPMNVISGMADLLISENLNYRQHRYAQDIKTSSVELLDIINDVLDLSKIQSAKLKLIPIHFNFEDFINHIASVVLYLIKDKALASHEKEISFSYETGSGVPSYLYGDDVRLRQIFINLLSNAVKYTKKGSIFMKISMAGGAKRKMRMRVDISDTGSGIRQEDIPSLFNEFEQVNRVNTRNQQGTGLGLAITKSLVEMMGGEVWCESTYGEGSTFSFIIPITAGDADKVEKDKEAPIPIYAPDAEVLIVDDRELNLSVMYGLLEQCEIDADMVASGAGAVEKAETKVYDLIFMDHMMPDMDGIEATKILRESGCTVPIVALTANAVSGAREQLIAAGMDDFLAKPIEQDELYRVLRDWLPKDKIKEKSAAVIVNTDNDNNEMFWELAGAIEGISIDAGLATAAGNRNNYKNTLNLLKREIIKSAIALRELLSNEDLKGFCTEVHGIKGSLSLAGALGLSAAARELENASRNGDARFCEENLADFLSGLIGLGNNLKRVFDMSAAGAAPQISNPGISDELLELFTGLNKAMDNTDIDVIYSTLDILKGMEFEEGLDAEIANLTEALQIMDYSHAKSIIKRLTH